MSFKLCFFAPLANVEACKEACFAVKAGTYPGGIYNKVSFETRGIGQFRPLEGANPHLGQENQLHTVEEARVEIFCGDKSIAKNAVDALKKAHPYEQPAYEVIRIEDF